MNRLKLLLEVLYILPSALLDKWLSEARLATQRTIELELSSEEIRRRRAARTAELACPDCGCGAPGIPTHAKDCRKIARHPKQQQDCVTCKYQQTSVRSEPCASCTPLNCNYEFKR